MPLPNTDRTPQRATLFLQDKPTAAATQHSELETVRLEGYTVQLHAITHGALSVLCFALGLRCINHAATRESLWNSNRRLSLKGGVLKNVPEEFHELSSGISQRDHNRYPAPYILAVGSHSRSMHDMSVHEACALPVTSGVTNAWFELCYCKHVYIPKITVL